MQKSIFVKINDKLLYDESMIHWLQLLNVNFYFHNERSPLL